MGLYKDLRNIEFSSIVNDFVQYFKDNGDLREKTLMVPFSISVSDYKNDITVNKDLTFLFHSPSNYTKVAVTEKRVFSFKDGDKVEFLADHDSCWRDGTSRKINDFINKFMEELENSKMEEYSVHTSIGIPGIRLLDLKIVGSYDDKESKLIKA